MNTKTIFLDEFLNSMLNFCLNKLYELYDPEDESDDGSRFKSYIDQKENESEWKLVVLLHPLFCEFDKALEVKGYELDYIHWSAFEALMSSLIEHDPDRFYDLMMMYKLIYEEDSGLPVNITARNQMVVLFNEFARHFLQDFKSGDKLFLTNGKEGRTVVLDFIHN